MAADAEDSPELDVRDFRLWWQHDLPPKAAEGRSRAWILFVATLMVVGLAPVVLIALKAGGPSLQKEPPVVAAVGDGAAGQSSSGASATASSDIASLGKDDWPSAQADRGRSIDPSTQASLVSPPDALTVPHEPVRSTAPPAAPPAKTVWDSSSPAGAPKTPSVSERASSNGALATERGVKSDSRTKPPPAPSPSRVAVARREAAGAAMAADPGSEPILPETPLKPDAAATEPRSPQAETDTIPASFNRMLHTIGGLLGAKGPSAAQPESASEAADWAVQLAAPKSESEAKSDLKRFKARYASALKGSKVGVRKAVVDGETVYRLRVSDLSKADAAALCGRLKDHGGDCFLAR